MEILGNFTGLYSLSKTLRFELIPIGKTLENIEKKGLIAQDKQRAEEYKIVKGIIDRYHKKFINMCLHSFKLKLKSDGKNDSLEEYNELISKPKRNEKEDTLFKTVKGNLRKQIVSAFKKGSTFGDLFKKELIKDHLVHIAESEEEKVVIENFSKFTTYFTGFHENRKNMYSDEEKSTAIAYRLINENLPIFYDNIRSFEKIAESNVNGHFAEIEQTFKDVFEELNVEHISMMFCLEYFSAVLTQKSIEIYNKIIGGINEYVNLYNQQQKEKNKRLPLLNPLYKMILSDRVAVSWLPEKFERDEEIVNAINETISSLQPILSDGDKDTSLKYLLQHIGDYDLSRIYISNDLGLTDISQQMFGQYDVFTASIKNELRCNFVPTKKEKTEPELYEDRINKLFKLGKSFSIAYLNDISGGKESIEDYFARLGIKDNNDINLFLHIEMARVAADDILTGKHTNLNQSKEAIKLIKDLLDAFKALQRFIKPLLGSGDEAEKDNAFYAKLQKAWDTLNTITPLYNKVRDYLTRKPYSIDKIKLNFENKGNLLGGWVDSQTKSDNGTQYGGYIFRKKNSIGEYDFYLGISADTKLFRKDDSIINDGTLYERLDYYQIKGKTIFGASYQGNYEDDANSMFDAFHNEIIRLKLKPLFLRKGKETIIGYLKRIRETDLQIYNILLNSEIIKNKYFEMKQHILTTLASLSRVPAAIEISKRKELGIEEIYDEIDNIPSKSFGFFPIKTEDIIYANERDIKPLFLFKISNKDLAFAEMYSRGLRKSRGTDNLHTMYFKALLSMIQGTYDIGTGEVFYRRQTPGLADNTARHKANQSIKNKNKDNEKKESIFSYEIIKKQKVYLR